MPRYQITMQGRQWNCEALDREWAKRLFEANVGKISEAEMATLIDIDDDKPAPKAKPAKKVRR